MVGEIVVEEVPVSWDMHEYLVEEAQRIGISIPALMLILLDQGRKLWEAPARGC